MTTEQQRLKILTKCINMLSDWMCELPEWYDGMEAVGARVEMTLDLLQSLRGYIMAGSPVKALSYIDKLKEFLATSAGLDEETKAQVIQAAEFIEAAKEVQKDE